MEQATVPDVPSVVSPVPSYRSDNEQLPVWALELATSLQSQQRMSRASSIISTRTKISTNTAREEARSIDLNIDGVHFRINRDGSRITTSDFRDNLPPYSSLIGTDHMSNGSRGNGHNQDDNNHVPVRTGFPQSPDAPGDLLPQSSPRLEQRLASQNAPLQAPTDDCLSRNPSFTPGKETISVAKQRAASQNDVPTFTGIRRKPLCPTSHLRRRNGIRLPSLITHLTDEGQPGPSVANQRSPACQASPSWQYPHSAEPILGYDNHSFAERPPSRMFVGRDAPGLFPAPVMSSTSNRPPSLSDDQATIIATSPARIEEGYADIDPPPPMDSENDISVHYTRIIRTLDREQRKALHERDKEMAKLRERIHEQDTIYRQQLRARDFIIDNLKSRIAHVESNTEAAVEKACHAIEDMWESRWKDKNFHLMERMRRMETNLHPSVQKALTDRDKIWAKCWATKYKELIQRLESADQLSYDDLNRIFANPPILS